MLTILKAIRTLLGYVVCGLFFITPFIILTVFTSLGQKWAFLGLYGLDITICSICHGTQLESISARSYRLNHDKRYYYQMRVIDWLAYPFDGAEHCRCAYLWEQKYIRLG